MRVFALLLAAGLLAAGPASAQDTSTPVEDPNLRRPQLFEIAQGEVTEHFVVGDGAWGDVLATIAAVRSAEDVSDQTVIDQLWARRDLNPPIFLFEVARRAAASDPERAIEAWLLGRTRTLYDAARCVDSSSLQVLEAATNFSGDEIVGLMDEDGERLERVIRRVHESGATFGGLNSPWWACSFGDAAYLAALNDASMPGAEWLKREILWEPIRNQLNDDLQAYLILVRAGIAAQAE
jgi:hypothetical protein